MGYKKYYQDGWKSGVEGGTPITPEALNHMEDGIEAANENMLNIQHITDDEHIVPSGANLNAYTSPGAYRIATAAIAGSLRPMLRKCWRQTPACVCVLPVLIPMRTGQRMRPSLWQMSRRWSLSITMVTNPCSSVRPLWKKSIMPVRRMWQPCAGWPVSSGVCCPMT